MKKILLPLILTLILLFGTGCSAATWEVDTAVYAEKSKYVSFEEIASYGVTFSSDGTKMYIVGTIERTVYQYTLSTPWDVSTAEYAEKSGYVGDEDPYPYGITFSSDGTKMYIAGFGHNTAYQYTLSTAWDVDTATYANKYKDVSAQEDLFHDITFSSDGAKMYILGFDPGEAYQYTLSTAWDISTATYANKYKDVGAQDPFPYGIFFKPDGLKMYIMGDFTNAVHQYTLSTAWDVDTATYANKYKDVSAQDEDPYDVTFNSDGSKMYILGTIPAIVYQYTLPVGWPHKWNTKTIIKWNTKEIKKWNSVE